MNTFRTVALNFFVIKVLALPDYKYINQKETERADNGDTEIAWIYDCYDLPDRI